MALFDGKSHKEALILDIGSASVLLGLLEFQKDTSKLTYVNKFTSPLDQATPTHTAYKGLLAGAQALLSEFALRKQVSRTIPVFIFLPTLLHFSEMYPLHALWEKDQTITPTLLNTLAASATQDVFEKRKHTIETLSGAEFVTLEKHVTHSRLNGYDVSNPLGKKGRSYDGKLFVSYTSSDILGGIREMCEKTLHLKNLSFHSSVFALFNILETLYAAHPHFLIVNAGRELADFVFVSSDDITHLATLPVGERAILSTFAQALSIPFNEAQTIVGLVAEGSANAPMNERVEKGLDAIWKFIKEKVITAQNEGVFPKRLPMSVSIMGDPTMTYLYKEALKRGERDGLLFGKSPTISFLSPELFQNSIQSSFGENYTPLLVKALFAKRITLGIL